jgi:SAM-dependent methyltransferase
MKRLWRAVRPMLPHSAIDAVVSGHRRYLRYRCGIEDRRDRRHRDAIPFAEVPPAWLRYRVGGSAELAHFLAVGERTARDIHAALVAAGVEPDRFSNILDFGCGCGRTLLWMARDRSAERRWSGSDIDAEAIAWCRDHLGFARFAVNPALPPLDAPDGAYDLIYAISVFTHLDADRQAAWLGELRRVTRPGGVVLLTVHGEACAGDLPAGSRRALRDEGFLFARTDSTRGLFPDWYQAAYQTPEQVRDSFGRFFRLLAHIPRGINDHQDAVVLGRE